MMKAKLFVLFVVLLMVGCGEESQSLPLLNLNESEFEWTKKQFEWTKKQAEGGDKVAQFNLGVMYDYGEGVPVDDKEAVKWYTKSAEQGFAFAPFNLGTMYDNGEGVPKNPVQAYAWYNIAIANGNEEAKEWIKEIELELSSEQLIEAQSLSTEIFKRIEANKKD